MSYREIADADLVSMAAWDPDAFGELFKRHSRSVFAYCARRTGGQSALGVAPRRERFGSARRDHPQCQSGRHHQTGGRRLNRGVISMSGGGILVETWSTTDEVLQAAPRIVTFS